MGLVPSSLALILTTARKVKSALTLVVRAMSALSLSVRMTPTAQRDLSVPKIKGLAVFVSQREEPKEIVMV